MHETLSKIGRELDALISDASDEHPVDLHELHIIARRIEAQAEMIAQGLVEP